MSHHDDRGMATAEYAVGTLGAACFALTLYKFGILDDNPWLEAFKEILQRAFGWGPMRDAFEGRPRLGVRF
jgi:hypothetical protein